MKTALITVSETHGSAKVAFSGAVLSVEGDPDEVRRALGNLRLADVTVREEQRVIESMPVSAFLAGIATLVGRREKIRAIQYIREISGLDLKSAKDIVDVFCGQASYTPGVN